MNTLAALGRLSLSHLPALQQRHASIGAAGLHAETFVKRAPNYSSQCLQSLESVIIDHSVRLIIIDSIAALARSDFGAGAGGGSLADRQAMLSQQAARLKQLAETFRIPVLVTNQVGHCETIRCMRVGRRLQRSTFCSPEMLHTARSVVLHCAVLFAMLLSWRWGPGRLLL
jgi:hypothetical protein